VYESDEDSLLLVCDLIIFIDQNDNF